MSVPFKLIIKICVVFAFIVFAFNSTYFLNGVHGSNVSSKDMELVTKPGAELIDLQPRNANKKI